MNRDKSSPKSIIRFKQKLKEIIVMDVENFKAWEFANTRKGYWRIAK